MEVMTKDDIIEITNNFLVEEFEVDVDDISAEANMRETLELDSLDYVDMVVVTEAKFGVKLKGEDFKDIVTFNDFYNLIENKLK